jgi:hypothetical protein
MKTLAALLVFSVSAAATPAPYPTAEDSPRGQQISTNLFKAYREASERLGRNLPETPAGEKRLSAAFKKENKKFLRALQGQPLPKGEKIRVSLAEAEAVRASIAAHPVVGDGAQAKYDPKGEIGFCFGRATYVHLKLLELGLPAGSLGKVFAMGKFRSRGEPWDFHVATVVRGPGKSWLAIDHPSAKVLPVEEWMVEVEKLDRTPEAPTTLFYLTDAAKFLPHTGAYAAVDLETSYLRAYFADLAKAFFSR